MIVCLQLLFLVPTTNVHWESKLKAWVKCFHLNMLMWCHTARPNVCMMFACLNSPYMVVQALHDGESPGESRVWWAWWCWHICCLLKTFLVDKVLTMSCKNYLIPGGAMFTCHRRRNQGGWGCYSTPTFYRWKWIGPHHPPDWWETCLEAVHALRLLSRLPALRSQLARPARAILSVWAPPHGTPSQTVCNPGNETQAHPSVLQLR